MAKLMALVWLMLLGWGLSRITERIAPLAQSRHQLVETAPLASLDTRLLNIITIGYRGLYDDIATIFSIQMLVDDRLKSQATAPQVAHTLAQLTRHQPRIESLYMLSCFVLTFDLKMPELCEPITLDGMKALPESWRIPVTQAFVSLRYLQDSRNAAIYYGLAASRPQAPAFLARLTRSLVESNQLAPAEITETMTKLLGSKEGSRFFELLAPRRPAP